MSFFSGPDKNLGVYTATINGKTITKRLPKNLSDEEVRRAFAEDYAAANMNAKMAPVKGGLFGSGKRRQDELRAPPDTLESKLTGVGRDALSALGMDPREAHRLSSKAFGFLNDLTPVGDAVSADDARSAWNRGDYLAAAGNAGLAALGSVPVAGDMAGKVAEAAIGPLFHVSPHKFDKFSLDHLGTGEGAQMYGRGLYFAEQPDGPTATHYRQMFGPKAATYEVEIDADPEHLLDYDAPSWDQPESVKRLMREVGMYRDRPDLPIAETASGKFTLRNIWGESAGTFKTREAAEAKRQSMISGMGEGTGTLLYNRLGGNNYYPHLDDGAASRKLLEEGIRGGKWRNASGESNYVVFDDSIIDILNRR